MKRLSKILSAIIAICLCICLVVPAAADFDFTSFITDLLTDLNSSSLDDADLTDIYSYFSDYFNTDDINLSGLLAEFIEEQVNDESLIDRIINNIKYGVTEDEEDEESVEVDSVKLSYALELFNLTVNRIKTEQPGFMLYTTYGLDTDYMTDNDLNSTAYAALSGLITAMFSGNELATEILSSILSSSTYTETTRYYSGDDLTDEVGIIGTEYMSTLTEDQAYNYGLTVYNSGAYAVYIELPEVTGSAEGTGYASLYDLPTTSNFSVTILGTTFEIPLVIKYITGYAYVVVNRYSEITSYSVHIEVTAEWDVDESNTYLYAIVSAMDIEEEGLILIIDQTYSAFNWDTRPLGDVDNDGDLELSDARKILRYVLELDTYDEDDFDYLDVDLDGVLTMSDARLALRGATGLEELPDAAEVLGIDYTSRDETLAAIDELLVEILELEAESD